MRLVRLGLNAFGKFNDQIVDLGPGFNVVFGPNEAGKSTIQKFVLGMLYGLKKQGIRRDYSPDHGRYQPWGGDEYRGSLIYRLDDGRRFRVERDFSIRRERVAVFDDETGENLTETFAQDRRKEILFAERHLRVGEGVFVSTAWVGQLETSKLAMARELSTRVANLQESGREDLSVREALRILDEQLKDIGSERAPSRPYARTLRLIEERETELQRATQARTATNEWDRRLAEAQAQLAQVSAQYDLSAGRFALARLRESENSLEQARRLGTRLAEIRPRLEDLQAFAAFPSGWRDEVQRLAPEVAALAEQEEHEARRLEALSTDKDRLEDDAERFGRMQALPNTALSDLTTALALLRSGERQVALLAQEVSRVAESSTRLEETLGPLQDVAERGADVAARVEGLEREINQLQISHLADVELEAEGEASPGRTASGAGSGRAGGVAVFVLGLALAAAGGLYMAGIVLPKLLPGLEGAIPMAVAGAGVLLALVGVYFTVRGGSSKPKQRQSVKLPPLRRGGASALPEGIDLAMRQRLRELEAQREQLLSAVRATSAADLKSRLIRWEQFAARRDSYQARLNTLQAELEQRHSDLAEQRMAAAAVLAPWQGVAPEQARLDDQAIEEFRQAWERWGEVRQRYQTAQRDFAETAQRHRGASERLAGASTQLQQYLSKAGAADVADYLRGCRNREEYQTLHAEYVAAQQGLEQALRGQTLEGLAAQVEGMRRRIAEAAAAELLPADDPDSLSSVLLEEELRLLERQRSDVQKTVDDLSVRLDMALRDTADLADLQRDLSGLREELAAMDRELQSLELARDTIEIVSGDIHREFAPVLNQTIGAILSNVTGGRYAEVKVDENLGLRALAQRDRLVEVWDLSSGTIDQFYFALRLALVGLLTAGGERLPLLLDDPFVQYDDERLRGSLSHLQGLAGEGSQIVLFTCHRRDVEVARSLGSYIVDLTGM